MDLADIPEAHRKGYLQHQVQKISPFKETAFTSHVIDGAAQLWVWDQAFQRNLADGGNFAFIPEQLMLQSPADGLVLRSNGNRSQLEYWRHSVLKAFQSFDKVPGKREVDAFCLANKIQGQEFELNELGYIYRRLPLHVPPAFSLQWFSQSWVVFNTSLTICLVALLVALGYLSGWGLKVMEVRGVIENEQDVAQELLDKRQQLLSIDARYSDISSQFIRISPLEILASFESLVGSFYSDLISLEYVGGVFSVRVGGVEKSARDFITALSDSPVIVNVRVEPDNQPGILMISFSSI